jgi:tRNA1(Val) A37 N6-methylase TrmN6
MTLVCADPETAPSMVLVESKKGGAPGLTVTPPLVLYGSTEKSGTRTLSEAAQRVYDTCSLYPL